MYYTPCNEFVAGLFGEPEINLIPAVMKTENGSVHFRMLDQPVDIVPADDTVEELLEAGTDQVDIGLRGNDIRFAFERPGDDWFEGTVYANEPIGNKVIMTVDVGSCKLAITCPNDTAADLDQKVYIRPNMKNALYFHGETKEFITRNNNARYTGKKN